MNLLIDVGNTRTKYCFVSQGQITDITAVLNTNFDKQYFNEHFSKVSLCVISNVSNKTMSEVIEQWAEQANVTLNIVNSENTKNTVVAGYTDIKQLGVDRWLAILGAQALYPNKNLIVVDAGTATTVDIINENAQHQGGWILPGVITMIDSLAAKTDKVKVKYQAMDTLRFGQNTSDCVNNACWAATLGLISQAKLILATNKQATAVIITGGNAQQILQLSHEDMHYREDLVFTGLLQYT